MKKYLFIVAIIALDVLLYMKLSDLNVRYEEVNHQEEKNIKTIYCMPKEPSKENSEKKIFVNNYGGVDKVETINSTKYGTLDKYKEGLETIKESFRGIPDLDIVGEEETLTIYVKQFYTPSEYVSFDKFTKDMVQYDCKVKEYMED